MPDSYGVSFSGLRARLPSSDGRADQAAGDRRGDQHLNQDRKVDLGYVVGIWSIVAGVKRSRRRSVKSQA